MKRFFCALLACCLTLTAGCGGASSVSSAATGAAGAQAPASGQLVEQGAGFVFGGSGLTGQTPSGGSTLVAEPLEEGAAAPAPGQFMALESYGAGLEVEKENRSGNSLVRSYKGEPEAYEAIRAYVELLCTAYDFELAAEPYTNTVKNTYFDFCLNYTGEQGPASHTQEGTFSKTPCDLTIYGTIDRYKVKGAIWYDPSLSGVDGGYRYGREGADTTPAGESALAGLLRGADGSYSTTDGRLTAPVGGAALLWDGEAEALTARYARYTADDRQQVQLFQNSAEQLRFYLPLSCQLTTGSIFGKEQFIIESGYAVNAGGWFDEMPSYTWPSMFAVKREDGWLVPVLGMSGDMKSLFVRVMYANESTAVVYACAGFNSAPYTLELLAAVSLENAEAETTPAPGGGGSGNCSACGGSGDCTTCGGTGRVKKALAGTGKWVEQDCTACRPAGSGNCSFCGGDGRA